jgi:hypothetical protein
MAKKASKSTAKKAPGKPTAKRSAPKASRTPPAPKPAQQVAEEAVTDPGSTLYSNIASKALPE